MFLDPSEKYIAFQQGLVDVIFTSPDIVLNQKLYESGKYGLMSDPVAPHRILAMNLDRWNSLSPELQDIWMDKILPESIDWVLENAMPYYDECMQKLIDEHGMTIHYMSAEERIAFRNGAFEMAKEKGYYDLVDEEFLRLADHLRSEPYDTGPLFP